jgi:hypothetical protein
MQRCESHVTEDLCWLVLCRRDGRVVGAVFLFPLAPTSTTLGEPGLCNHDTVAGCESCRAQIVTSAAGNSWRVFGVDALGSSELVRQMTAGRWRGISWPRGVLLSPAVHGGKGGLNYLDHRDVVPRLHNRQITHLTHIHSFMVPPDSELFSCLFPLSPLPHALVEEALLT